MSALAQGTSVPVVRLPHNVDLPVIFYQGQPVITLAMMDKAHQRTAGTARRNFNANKDRLVNGEDCFQVCANEIRTHKIMPLSGKAHGVLILLTETGYLMLVKSFNDELAWQVQRKLIRTYFRIQPERQEIALPILDGQLVVDHFDDGTQRFNVSGFYYRTPANAMSAAIGLSEFARDLWERPDDGLPETIFTARQSTHLQ